MENILEIRNLVKVFPGVRAVDDVSFDVKRNTVHCLVGENGAGKSTLIKILTGAYTKTGGSIKLNGAEYQAGSTGEARAKGITTLFQELNVVDQLTVEENLTLGREDTTLGFLRRTDKINKCVSLLHEIEPSINPKAVTSTLSVAQKQIIEITKAAASKADIIIMDEPTASLSENEAERLFRIIRELCSNNMTVIYISHRLDEIFKLGSYVTVMRDGRHIGTKPISEVKDRGELIKMMVGKMIRENYIPNPNAADEKLLEIKDLSNHKLKQVSLHVNKGEIVGFYGLIGAGKTELARAVFGVDAIEAGEILYKGRRVGASPSQMIEAGIALVPEERRTQGLFTLLTIKANIPVMKMDRVSRNGFMDKTKEREVAESYVRDMGIATNSIEKEVGKLSGGNQQKVVFSKCLCSEADLFMLDEPTRGIDVGAKSEIYNIIRRLSSDGKSIMIFSSELPELLSVCDRFYLLFDGRIKAELKNSADIDSEKIVNIVTGGDAA
ncbi:MAG: sugar ABC transporter ATP-binding protein [Synergistaceae bacterium]|jgi:ribose transport system ATP-binding protein|nr:sugar ABC transporter ATP-binding protein [Synergistaceae bacterium]